MASALNLPRLKIDFETRSFCDLPAAGAWAYSEHSTTEILCMGWKLGKNKTKLWVPGEPFPQEIIDHVANGDVVSAFHAQFERAIWLNQLTKKLGIAMPQRWYDTMACCAYKSLPTALDKVGLALDSAYQKDPRGKFLITQLCKPKQPTKAIPYIHFREDFALLEELHEYCMNDVDTEDAIGNQLGDMPEGEYQVWLLDQKINQRGVLVDMDAVRASAKMIEVIIAGLMEDLTRVTEGVVEKPTQVQRIKKWLEANGLKIKSLDKDALVELLERDDLSDDIRTVLRARQIGGRTSVAKIYSFLACVCDDDRVRGMLQYHGAGTGRWSGRLVQPQNFPRGTLDEKIQVEELIAIIKTGDMEAINMIYGDPIEVISHALRGMFITEDGKYFLVSDFSAIEAVVLAWLAGEEWKLGAFRLINNGELYEGAEDIYCATAAGILGRPVTKANKADRQIGKTAELAFGYGGGVHAWYNFDKSGKHSIKQIEDFRDAWRAKHPKVEAMWHGLETACMNAVNTNRPHSYNNIVFNTVHDAAGKWLTIRLPSGRLLWYYDPKVEPNQMPWTDKNDNLVYRDGVSYMGRDNKNGGVWRRVRTYGGMLTENIVQAISRDIMVEAMFRVEKAGYETVMTVHDEVVAECEVGKGDIREFDEMMSIPPAWMIDCPVKAVGHPMTRYRK